jgi:hypothetical protein
MDRVQLHRNPNRGVPYLPLSRKGAEAGRSSLTMRAIKKIELDGNPLQNIYGNLRPLDANGDGKYDFVHFNGYRWMQVWDNSGRKLWRISNRDGRIHDYREGTHRDTLAVLDLDDDGKRDIAHCWLSGGKKALVFRRGRDGKVIRSIPVPDEATTPCQIAAFRLAETRKTVILVSHEWRGKPGCKINGFIDSWAMTVAFDTSGRKLWQTRTCEAGHYAYPYDRNFDGWAEGVFVGKYHLRANGQVKCVLDTWPVADHVDGMVVGNLQADRAGLELAAVGRTGLASFDPDTCKQIWRVSTRVVRDPQHLSAAKLDPKSSTPVLVVEERGSLRRSRTMFVSGGGRVLRTSTQRVIPMQNANLDGALGVDEKVAEFGVVIDRFGNTRLGRSWFWRLKGHKVRETGKGFYPSSYDRWQAFPLVFDYDRDGRDEIVQWGQSLIAVGKVD